MNHYYNYNYNEPGTQPTAEQRPPLESLYYIFFVFIGVKTPSPELATFLYELVILW